MIKMDDGASKLGEFGIAINTSLTKHTKQILFDEKMAFTIHLALGRAYKKGNGRNESSLHWDMILNLREQGEIWIDDKCIQRNGSWLINF